MLHTSFSLTTLSTCGSYFSAGPYRGLAWLAFANVVGAAILVAVSVVLRNEDSGRGVSDLLVRNIQTVRFAAISAQVLAWAIIFAFALRRRFVGLLLSAAFAIALGTINWVGFVLQDPTSASVAASSVWGNLLAFSIFAIAQGLRFLLGLRLVLQDELPASSAIRFGIGDLIEWMVSIGIFFGLGHLGGWFHNLMLLARHVAWWVLVSLPAALSIWSRRGPLWVSFLVTVSVPFVATATFEYSNGYFNSPAASRWRFIEHIAFLAASYIVATAANFVVVRRLGFAGRRPAAKLVRTKPEALRFPLCPKRWFAIVRILVWTSVFVIGHSSFVTSAAARTFQITSDK